ncbi:hypothetical protein GCM10007387_29560 [Pseudoduganella albidiflava]|uniref:Uncharacterized protein n=1 Tax=Pseudoduganella albidiflava TaxID=321983 RepID=A0AA87XTW9_9BURK|nr:hypothetical protein GCM10007387_29560 [Pseudoduganella albidiflava]
MLRHLGQHVVRGLEPRDEARRARFFGTLAKAQVGMHVVFFMPHGPDHAGKACTVFIRHRYDLVFASVPAPQHAVKEGPAVVGAIAGGALQHLHQSAGDTRLRTGWKIQGRRVRSLIGVMSFLTGQLTCQTACWFDCTFNCRLGYCLATCCNFYCDFNCCFIYIYINCHFIYCHFIYCHFIYCHFNCYFNCHFIDCYFTCYFTCCFGYCLTARVVHQLTYSHGRHCTQQVSAAFLQDPLYVFGRNAAHDQGPRGGAPFAERGGHHRLAGQHACHHIHLAACHAACSSGNNAICCGTSAMARRSVSDDVVSRAGR